MDSSSDSFLSFVYLPVPLLVRGIEKLLFVLIHWYDLYCYSPLQICLSPMVSRIPRSLRIGGRQLTIFTANIVSWARTLLVIPVAYCLKYDYNVTAFSLIMFHDFLDHLDGIVAKVQKQVYGPLDDPLLGGFMDAFCDKIVNVFSLWTILMVTDFSGMSAFESLVYLLACSIIITYEFILGVVRVQDYFSAYYARKYGKLDQSVQSNTAAVMEGKLKEKLESLGIGFLCLSQSSRIPIESIGGVVGVACLFLSVRLAHASLQYKLTTRGTPENDRKENPPEDSSQETESETQPVTNAIKTKQLKEEDDEKEDKGSLSYSSKEASHTKRFNSVDLVKGEYMSDDDEKDDSAEKDLLSRSFTRSHSIPILEINAKKVDKVYTIGCFDLFHKGHVILINRMKEIGKQVIVGVHDSRSIFKLKKRVPIDSTAKRMANVKQHADIVFCVHGTDPTPYLKCIFDQNEECTSIYVRGDDMTNFPSRATCENLMPIHFLPYTQSVSSTKIRKEMNNATMFGPHVHHEDHTMFY
ncbi:hypothetical protein ACJMK2_010681 [Sinanodonta woodiana]|uniref:Cytidyltransferase-like domain-containing protein n=1 Tax=Sinanodonta woodiana TaxID=1069815 RepID=A0ABD3VG64_SINWO